MNGPFDVLAVLLCALVGSLLVSSFFLGQLIYNTSTYYHERVRLMKKWEEDEK